ncbi:MAG: transcription initiation factor IIB family protein [Halobacteriales archaeon]
MYRASDRTDNEDWLAELGAAADSLELSGEARSIAEEVFLSSVPDRDRSKRAVVAASLYAGALVAGEQRSQSSVADAAGVSRLTVQQRWKDVLENAGLRAPEW